MFGGESSLLVTTTPRLGSWYLCDHLTQTGRVGVIQEYFHVNYVAALSQELGLTSTGITGEYIDRIRRTAAGENGVFGAKIHWLQMNQLVTALRHIHPALARAGAAAPDLIESSLPDARYVYLTRRDKARQAISMFKAMRSDQWWERSGLPSAEPPPRDPD